MKKIILIATALFLGLSAVAQDIPAGNWFIKVGGGANVSMDGYKYNGRLDSHVGGGPALDLKVGKLLNNVVGVGIGYTGLGTSNMYNDWYRNDYHFAHADLFIRAAKSFVPYVNVGYRFVNDGGSVAGGLGFMFPIQVGQRIYVVPDISATLHNNNGFKDNGTPPPAMPLADKKMGVTFTGTLGLAIKLGPIKKKEVPAPPVVIPEPPVIPEPEFHFAPSFTYIQPDFEAVKKRALPGHANLEFLIGKSNVLRDYRNNSAEIAKIVDVANGLINNPEDYRVTNILLKGFASPDGSYKSNERLAKARTESLRNIVANSLLNKSVPISTDYVAEDWDGVKKWVENSYLPNKDRVLAIVNDYNLTPDAKDAKIRTSCPQDYKIIKEECYPSLRRSEYQIDYEITNYTDPEHIKKKIKTHPKDLSLNEFFIAANSTELGSKEFNEIMEAALKQYPTSEVAIVNAGIAALQSGYMSRAKELLNIKFTDPNVIPTATYARGMLKAIEGDYKEAGDLFNSVKNVIPKAADALKQLQDAKKY